MRWEAFLALAVLIGTAPVASASFVLDDTDPPAPPEAADERHPGPAHVYHTWETLTVSLQQLVNQNPDIARLHHGGESVLGFDLWVVEIADFEANDSVPLDDREVVWLDGGTHANEQLGTELAYAWIEFLIDGYGDNETATWIVENRHTYIMPMVNPDGNHKDTRQNARAVDLNRNYPVGWGALDEGRPPVGPGSYPLSEPETRAIVDWWERTQPDYINSFHTGIELMLYPPGYEESKPADEQVYRTICEEIGEEDPGFCGPIFSTIYPAAGGSIDTSYERWGSISFAYELDGEQNLYASQQEPRERLERYWDGVEHAFLNVERYGAHPVLDGIAVAADEVELTVTNEGYGNLTWAQVTLQVPGAEDPTLEIGRLEPGQTATLSASVPVDAADEDRLSVAFHYPERVQASPMDTRTVDLPVAVEGGELVAQQLEAPVDGGEALDVASVDDGDADGVPAPGAVLAGLALVLVAALARRRR